MNEEKDLLTDTAEEEKFILDLLLGLFNKLPDAVVIVDENRHIYKINPQAEFLFGYTETELKGKPIEVLVPDEAKERHEKHTEKFIDDPHLRAMGVGLELRAKKKNKMEIPVEINLGNDIELGTK